MKLSAYEFAQAIEARIEALSPEQFHERPRDAKRLLEELYPLSRLALSFKQPGLTVFVEANEDSGRADGQLWLAGFLDKTFEVQVTFAGYERAAALRSSLLLQQALAPGGRGEAVNRPAGQTAADSDQDGATASIGRLGISIGQRIRSKAAKPYAPGTVLLVAFEDPQLRGRGGWSRLYQVIENAGGIECGPFAEVYLFNTYSNELQRAA
ncbi:MAG: hypothetical protein H6R15_4368 [Proteobacteria bacterium]|nr:hypothetical protein [Pseudomonadota bacterium]